VTDERPAHASEVSEILTDLAGLVPHLIPLAEALGATALDRRVLALAARAVADARSRSNRAGTFEDLTASERSAIALALGTIGQPLDEDLEVDHADEHFTPQQIRQVQAVALAIDLLCRHTPGPSPSSPDH